MCGPTGGFLEKSFVFSDCFVFEGLQVRIQAEAQNKLLVSSGLASLACLSSLASLATLASLRLK